MISCSKKNTTDTEPVLPPDNRANIIFHNETNQRLWLQIIDSGEYDFFYTSILHTNNKAIILGGDSSNLKLTPQPGEYIFIWYSLDGLYSNWYTINTTRNRKLPIFKYAPAYDYTHHVTFNVQPRPDLQICLGKELAPKKWRVIAKYDKATNATVWDPLVGNIYYTLDYAFNVTRLVDIFPGDDTTTYLRYTLIDSTSSFNMIIHDEKDVVKHRVTQNGLPYGINYNNPSKDTLIMFDDKSFYYKLIKWPPH
jgi:hypothetical protein